MVGVGGKGVVSGHAGIYRGLSVKPLIKNIFLCQLVLAMLIWEASVLPRTKDTPRWSFVLLSFSCFA